MQDRACETPAGGALRLVLRHVHAVTSAMRTSPRWMQAGSAPNALLSSATTSTAALSLTRAAQVLARADLPGKDGAQDDEAAREAEPANVGLLGGFTVLRAQLRLVPDVHALPLPLTITHFLGVIVSARTSGAVTQVALEALTAFLDRGLFRTSSVGLERAVQDVAHAASHCRFEPSDAGRDEVVLLSILDLMYALVCGHAVNDDGSRGAPLVDMLGDESVCELMETCLSMCCQTRLSTALRRAAEQKMICMLREIFSRLETMPLERDEAYAASGRAPEPELATLTAAPVGADADDEKRLHMAMPDPKSRSIPAAGGGDAPGPEAPAGDTAEPEDKAEPEGTAEARAAPAPSEAAPSEPNASVSEPILSEPSAAAPQPDDPARAPAVLQAPFSLPALKEVLRVVISLLDPGNLRHTMTMRLLGLSLLGALLETHSTLLMRFPSLRALLQDSACRYLLQMANAEQPQLVAGGLRVLTSLLQEQRTHLKMQQELVLQFLLQQLRPAQTPEAPWRRAGEAPVPLVSLPSFRAGAQGEMRELFMEALAGLLEVEQGAPDVLVALWRNYDCDISCADLYQQVTHFLCLALFAPPSGASGRTGVPGLALVALDLVLGLVARMAERHERDAPVDAALPAALRAARARKEVLAAGAAAFNEKPKHGIAFLEQAGLLTTDEPAARAASLARFLKDSALVDKRLLGDYISRAENLDVLSAFLDLFDFTDTDVAEAMRALCEAFRLPGEAQQIARITETFAHKYFLTRPPGIRSEDAVYVLAYSIIMLNTDLHNPQVTRRMTIADYQRNLRGVNDGQDFDEAYLAAIYDSIRRREIVMPEEQAGQLGFDYTWKELLRRARLGNELLPVPDGMLDADLFRTSWRPFVASIVQAFATLQDEHLLQRAIAGCRQCAELARAYDVPDVFDYMVEHLAQATGLLDAAADAAAHAVYEHDGTEITISPLSVAFGSHFKGQLAAVVLFTIAHSHGPSLRTSWGSLLRCIESLLSHALLPPRMATMVGYGGEAEPVPLKSKDAAPLPSQAPVGLFSTLSSYFLSPYGAAAEPMDVSEADVESTLCTLDCLASCQLDGMHEQVLSLPPPALCTYVDALLARLAALPPVPEYRAAPLFWLEQLERVLRAHPTLLVTYGARAMESHTVRISQAARVPPLELERAVFGALRLVAAYATAEGVAAVPGAAHTQLVCVMQALRDVPSALHASVSPAFLAGLEAVVRGQGVPLDTDDEWRTLLHLLSTYARVRRAPTARAALGLAAHLLAAPTALTLPPLMELVRDLISSADRALWHHETGAARRTLTEKRELGEWMAAVHASSGPALQALAQVREALPALVQAAAEPGAAWAEYWLPLLAALSQPCVSMHRPTRLVALTCLQQAALAPALLEPAPQARHREALLGHILLPLLETLLAPETARADAHAADEPSDPAALLPEAQAQVCLLVCRVWVRDVGVLLRDVPPDVEAAGAQRVVRLWVGVLGAVAHVLQGTARPTHELIEEQLKNMVLVMHAAGCLADGGAPGTLRRAMWVETWRRLDALRPALRELVTQAT
ncbi:GDP/GTP exchange factor for ARF [Malassezia caprae]|uniref:GDP/GTP exchange factor for ARF n=1 Tax=Malassezia caprae TaxID=1381934 RepID=A0AAF0E9G1_9BASI|nr:GDP/GTP exchange factor for ARF [Malassezia caprae]